MSKKKKLDPVDFTLFAEETGQTLRRRPIITQDSSSFE